MDKWQRTLTITMDVEDDIGNHFKADVTMSLQELRNILHRYRLDLCEQNTP